MPDVGPRSPHWFCNLEYIKKSLCIKGLHPQSPRHFACHSSARVSQTSTALLPQSHDSSCYVSRPVVALPSFWLQKQTDLRAHYFAQSPDLWHQPRIVKVTCALGWRLYGINPVIRIWNIFGRQASHEHTKSSFRNLNLSTWKQSCNNSSLSGQQMFGN